MADESSKTVEETEGDALEEESVDTDDATGADKPKSGKDKPKPDSEDPEWVKKRLQRELEKIKRDNAEELKRTKAEVAEAERKQIRKEQLLEKQNFEELAEISKQEAEEAHKKLAEYERKADLTKLMDVNGIKEPAFKEMFENMSGDLEVINQVMSGFQEVFDAAVKREVKHQVDNKLGSDPPPKKPKEEQPMDIDAQIEAAVQKGDWATSLALKAQKSAQNKAAR